MQNGHPDTEIEEHKADIAEHGLVAQRAADLKPEAENATRHWKNCTQRNGVSSEKCKEQAVSRFVDAETHLKQAWAFAQHIVSPAAR